MSHTAKHLVIGGAGFLGSHIVRALKTDARTQVLVFDLVAVDSSSEAWVQDVEYEVGDICDEAKLLEVFQRFKPDVIYHTASPIHGPLSSDVYHKVNVRGTETILSACKTANITRLIYTSSTGVVWTGADIIGATEDDLSIPPKGYDAYHHTKALGERLALGQNGVDGMQIVVLRPCGMTGERDKQLIWRLAKILDDGQQNIQIGNNKNLVDYLYVGNAAHAHVLAADCLLQNPTAVAGEVFFITNGSPMPNWDFNRLVWKELGDNRGSKWILTIPRPIAMVMATFSEFWSKITRKPTEFNRFNIRFITGVQWYNIEKARLCFLRNPYLGVSASDYS
ncbi:3-beta hydroxysteroid dehydrogenase/isomerase family-domain-containing protein [Lentinula raphanica]|nr:3-beta hydroxysteroid dehydrogenase/isomerase family-domain-containing protein [Lentinula raphanica]